MRIKNIVTGLSVLVISACLCSCGSSEKIPEVHISFWSSEQNYEFVEQAVENFKYEHKDEVNLNYTISVEGEDTCKDVVVSNIDKAADIFFFADNQTSELIRAGALLENTLDSETVIKNSGGSDSAVSKVVTRDGKVYAYPFSAGNGYFLYYNKKYFSGDDIKSLDTMLKKAVDNGKKITMNLTSGWYLYSFFRGAGLELSCAEDSSGNICNWNATDTKIKGTDVTESLLSLAASDGFVSLEDDEFVEGVKDGTIIAGVNGLWNSKAIKEAWGDDFGAAKLPEYYVSGDSVQMYSFSGYKLLGINSHTENPEWCMKIASYLTSEENQLMHFEKTGECPVNQKVANSEIVQNAPEIAALMEQSPFSDPQNIADPFWLASNRFGITIVGKNSSNRDLQELLDEITEQITAPVSEGN